MVGTTDSNRRVRAERTLPSSTRQLLHAQQAWSGEYGVVCGAWHPQWLYNRCITPLAPTSVVLCICLHSNQCSRANARSFVRSGSRCKHTTPLTAHSMHFDSPGNCHGALSVASCYSHGSMPLGGHPACATDSYFLHLLRMN